MILNFHNTDGEKREVERQGLNIRTNYSEYSTVFNTGIQYSEYDSIREFGKTWSTHNNTPDHINMYALKMINNDKYCSEAFY